LPVLHRKEARLRGRFKERCTVLCGGANGTALQCLLRLCSAPLLASNLKSVAPCAGSQPVQRLP
jgi:hypothetical protein